MQFIIKKGFTKSGRIKKLKNRISLEDYHHLKVKILESISLEYYLQSFFVFKKYIKIFFKVIEKKFHFFKNFILKQGLNKKLV